MYLGEGGHGTKAQNQAQDNSGCPAAPWAHGFGDPPRRTTRFSEVIFGHDLLTSSTLADPQQPTEVHGVANRCKNRPDAV